MAENTKTNNLIFDIAFNYTSEHYNMKNDKNDMQNLLMRTKEAMITPFFVGSDYQSSQVCLEASKLYNTFCYVGIHPNDATEHKNEIENIRALIEDHKKTNLILPNVLSESSNYNKEINDIDYNSNKETSMIESKIILNNDNNTVRFFNKKIINNIIAIGECGLDYYRKTSTQEDQKYVFESLLSLNYPLYFLHNRDSFKDFMDIICDHQIKGVVHSFDGSIEEAKELIKKGYYIGINGCSLKTIENVKMVEEIPIEYILVETDAPYCRIGRSYEGHKYLHNKVNVSRKRNEPITVVEVVDVIAQIKEINTIDIKEILFNNTINCYGNSLKDYL